MKLTPSQQAAIEHRGSNMLVAASAGSGKTEVLARRCVSLIADEQRPCGVERLLVVTFTRAAAAELRARIAGMLRETAERETNRVQQRRLREQSLLVDLADIGTIDAWCGRIVREHFAQAGIDTEFSVLGAEDAILIRRAQLDRLFDGLHRGTEPLAPAARAWFARTTAPGDDFLRELVERLNAFREHLVNPVPWFEAQRVADGADATARLLTTALAEECRFQHAQLAALLAGAADDVEAAVRAYSDALAGWISTLNTPSELQAVVADIAAFKIPKPRKRKGDTSVEAPLVGEVRKRWLDGRLKKPWEPDAVAEMVTRAPDVAALTATLLDLEDRYETLLQETKRAQATYEFGDVLRMALDLLGDPAGDERRTPTDVARRLRGRYEHVLVDEYQDTSPVQVELLRLVTREGAGATNRFMVGDVKQSIYGFRQAEPRLFAEQIEAFEDGTDTGRVQYLSDNFRSHAGVLDALNEVFARLFDRRLGGTQFGVDERLQAGRAELPNPTLSDESRVSVHVVETEVSRAAAGEATEEADTDADADVDRIEREAQLAADEIRRMLATGVQVPGRSGDESLVLRPLRLGDIVILLRSARENAVRVARVLRSNGLRCMAAGREGLLDAPEVRDVCTVLEMLANRRQDVPMAAYLRGPLVGLSAAQLVEIRKASPASGSDFHTAVEQLAEAQPESSLGQNLKHALAQLDDWSCRARDEELPALLLRILQDGSLPLFARALAHGGQRVALLRALQDCAQAFHASGRGVAEFAEYLAALAAEEIDPGVAAAGDDDVIRIMTIHGSKGLEFPVVFLLGAGNRFNSRSLAEPLQCDQKLGLGLRFKDYDARVELTSAVHHVARQRVRQRELEEELRLLYVALTRARERLVVVGSARPGMWAELQEQYVQPSSLPLISRLNVSSRLEWVLMAAAAGQLHLQRAGSAAQMCVVTHDPGAIHVAPAAAPDTSHMPTDLTPKDEAWITRSCALLTKPNDTTLATLPAVLSVSAAKELASRGRPEDQARTLPMPMARLRDLPLDAPAAGPDGRVVGTACHRFLERADLTRLGSLSDVEAQVAAQLADGWLSDEQAVLVPCADVAWFGGTPEGESLARQADRVQREVPFVYALPAGLPGEHTIVRGVIDCLLTTNDGLVIIDYKTDAVWTAEAVQQRAAGYAVQLQLYAQAATAIFDRPVSRAVLAFLSARRVVDVPIAPVKLAANAFVDSAGTVTLT